MSTDFEWMRIALAMVLMTLGFFVLPGFFLWRGDKRTDVSREVARDMAHDVAARSEAAAGSERDAGQRR